MMKSKILEILNNNLHTYQAVNDDDPIHISGKEKCAEQCAQIAEQEKIAFAIEVLNDVYNNSIKNGVPFGESLSKKFNELKSLQDEKQNN